MIRNKVFLIINILGMGIAVACCIVAYLNNEFSATFDKHHVKGESIYRIQAWQVYQGSRNRHAQTPTPLGNLLRENVGQIDEVVRYTAANNNFRVGDEIFHAAVAYSDSAFFDLFNFELLSGSFDALSDKSRILISNELALKYYDTEEVTGRQITQLINGEQKEFTIGGVFKVQPLNSSFGFDAITLWDNYWQTTNEKTAAESSWKSMNTLFVQIRNPVDLPSIGTALQAYIEPQNKAQEDLQFSEYYLQQFSTLASNFHGETWLSGEQLRWGFPPSAVVAPGIMAIFLLLLACFNFTNTSIAIAGKRLKEIGVRKTMGGLRSELIVQFLGESLVICFVALLLGLLMAEYLVPTYNELWPNIELTLSYRDNVSFFFFLVLLLILTALIAGTYPALYVTSFKPVSILKGKLNFGGTNWFTRTLLTLQFSISLLCLIVTVAYMRNASYQKEYNLGYAKEGVIISPISGEDQFNAFKQRLLSHPDIETVAGTANHVSDQYYKAPVKFETSERQVEIVDIGDDYLNAMDIKLLAGRAFIKDSENDKRESVLVSKEFTKKFGIEDNPIGARLLLRDSLQLYVLGVVDDILTDGFWKDASPVMLRYIGPEKYSQLVVKTSVEKLPVVNDFMKAEWKKLFPDILYESQYTDGNLYATQMINTNAVRIALFFGVIAILMSATGLFALFSLNILKRMKEIGVRKILGASATHIAGVVNKEFILILVASAVLGSALGFLMTHTMMDAIWAYYQRVNIGTFAFCIGTLLVVAAITVAHKTFTTASMNPVDSLRE